MLLSNHPSHICTGCSSPIQGGSVISFEQALFHLNCFSCTKCHQDMDSQSNVLLMTDGRPVCENCSYVCSQCGLGIDQEAIMTGQDSYHPDCFRCTACHKSMDDLIYTQTSKGIYCTSCHQVSKNHVDRPLPPIPKDTTAPFLKPRQEKKSPEKAHSFVSSSNSSLSSTSSEMQVANVLEVKPLSTLPPTIPPESKPVEWALPHMSSLNLSFFDNDSSELDNLTQSLGINLHCNDSTTPAMKKLNDASELLKSSLSTPPNNTTLPDNADELKQRLIQQTEQLATLQSNLSSIQVASQVALDEFTKAKGELAKEMETRQQLERTILQLRQQLSSLQHPDDTHKNASTDVDRLSNAKRDLETTCQQLKEYRDVLATQIDTQAGSESWVWQQYPLALQEQIRSLQADRATLEHEMTGLNQARDDVIQEMIVLNMKNAELSSMNNDLSRRMSEREREAAAVMAGTSFLHAPSPSPSTEWLASSPMQRKGSDTSSLLMQRVTSRDSNSSSTSKIFKLKKPKSNVLNKITGFGQSPTSPLSPSTELYSLHTNASFMRTKHDTHAFVATSFLRPVKCSACGDKIWGASEYRCQDCGTICHGKCLAHLPGLCSATSSSLELVSPTESDGPKQVSMFGMDLTTRVAFEERNIPFLVDQCIAAVEARGMDYEGIYRKSGGAAQMRTIQLAFDANDPLDLKDEDEINDICAITSILKQYFRELPNPLLPYECYDSFMDAVRTLHGDAKTDKFIQLISQLPKANYDTMKRLMIHLVNVRNQSDENLMTTKNLAMVFGPTLLRDKDATRDLLDMSYKNATIEFIINHTPLLFTN